MTAGAIPASWADGFSRLERTHPGLPGAGWLAELRRVGMDRFSVLGFPTPRLEDWRKTNVAPIASVAFEPAFGVDGTDGDVGPGASPEGLRDARSRLAALGVTGPSFVFVNGRFSPELSERAGLPAGVEALSLAEAAATRRDLVAAHLGTTAHDISPFAALNTAFLRDGAFVHAPTGVQAAGPIFLVFLAAGSERPLACHPRVLVLAGERSRLRIVEVHTTVAPETGASRGRAPLFSNPVTELILEAGAVLDYDVLQPATEFGMRIACLGARIGRDASLASRSICLGGPLVRNDVRAVLDAEGAGCTLDGLFLARGGDHVDNHTLIDHAHAAGTSRELYKGILSSGGRGVFDGKILVRPDARKTDAMQTNRNLLLADDAVIDTKPQLEILNNDVRCKHAATIGRLDETAVFYLRSRGIGDEEARRILVQAFADEVLSRLPAESLRAPLSGAVTALLAGAGGRA